MRTKLLRKMKHKGCTHDGLEKRNKDILDKYHDLIRVENEKGRATDLNKSYFYDKVAEFFYLTPLYTSKLIRKMTKQSKRNHYQHQF